MAPLETTEGPVRFKSTSMGVRINDLRNREQRVLLHRFTGALRQPEGSGFHEILLRFKDEAC